MIRFIDLFCGIGGFRLGLERANGFEESWQSKQVDTNRDTNIKGHKQNEQYPQSFNCVWSCDNDKYARQIYKKNFGEEPEGDITKIPAESIPDYDLLCAGFPCQSFSIAGKRKGFADTRGTLFFDICRILQAKRPSYCLLENVKGLLSHDNGETFKTILESLAELGYDCQWQVLNSKHFGVPQNRERVFIVGHLRERRRPEVFPVRETNGISGKEQSGILGEYCIGNTLTKGYGALSGCGTRIESKMKIRRLTCVECERLQGFPDSWTAIGIDTEGKEVKISNTQRYKVLGNAVTVNVIEFLGERLKQEILTP